MAQRKGEPAGSVEVSVSSERGHGHWLLRRRGGSVKGLKSRLHLKRERGRGDRRAAELSLKDQLKFKTTNSQGH